MNLILPVALAAVVVGGVALAVLYVRNVRSTARERRATGDDSAPTPARRTMRISLGVVLIGLGLIAALYLHIL